MKTINEYQLEILKDRFGKEGHQVKVEDAMLTVSINRFFEGIGMFLNKEKIKDGVKEFNLANYLTVGVSHETIDGEKGGNYVPFIKPGSAMCNILGIEIAFDESEVDSLEEVINAVVEENEKNNVEIKATERTFYETHKILFETRILAVLASIKDKILVEDADEIIEIEEGEYLTYIVRKVDGKYKLFINTGGNIKKLVKSDEETEEA